MKNLYTSDLAERLEELQQDFFKWKDSLTEAQISQFKQAYATDELSEEEYMWQWGDEKDTGDAEELSNLTDLREELGCVFDDGTELISEDGFVEYAEQLAEDIGAISKNSNWPCNHIDWKRAAEDLKCDYSTVDFDGETYYYRES